VRTLALFFNLSFGLRLHHRNSMHQMPLSDAFDFWTLPSQRRIADALDPTSSLILAPVQHGLRLAGFPDE
jgi:hypothetical protein